jgi:hypothetical protein
MADTFGVTAQEVADQVPALFPSGFGDATAPTRSLVERWIAIADSVVSLAVQRSAGAIPDDDDPAAGIAKQYIISYTLAHVMRAVYAGKDPLQVKAAADQFAGPALELLAAIVEMGTQAAGDTAPVQNRVLGVDSSLDRDLVVTDDDLGGLALPGPGISRRRQF